MNFPFSYQYLYIRKCLKVSLGFEEDHRKRMRMEIGEEIRIKNRRWKEVEDDQRSRMRIENGEEIRREAEEAKNRMREEFEDQSNKIRAEFEEEIGKKNDVPAFDSKDMMSSLRFHRIDRLHH